ncbi:MAG: agmatine deiminase [Spiroplasma poulsonii]|uniref:Putative agmatine deiminase n=1 Tax=Spiroplasma poulsonii TaxID=2138 RepID=A0A2P6FFK0_9MOLU|nr:agmatine deiminase [Spiroplasma poulsonii]KAF0850063.1 Agmatine deiminase [Spiroplasma poulsonii]MBW1242349.1 agmatine deiminase [Spiroplasma poulsonii]PQM32240.1 Agmatine deiminase [Spiroplasma poulsonii]PWF94891.1 Agmatine deiminase [Spiroplasma poulsonii]PWF97687.1 Agmatine deiminase [Spiroplasma poulsonii]
MNKLLKTIPQDDEYYMPGEFEPHQGCWMVFPERIDNWRKNAEPAQIVYAKVANTINKYEPVRMITSPRTKEIAKKLLDPTIKILIFENDDAWMRDIGPAFLKNKSGNVRAVDWVFNAWGGLNGGLYFPWDNDDKIASEVCAYLSIDRYRTSFVLEGGSIHVDGEGTLYTTEECLLNPNRNPDLSKAEIEAALKQYLNIKKVIWLPYGIFNDETSGHIDNMCCVVKPGTILLAWTDDQNDPQYERSLAALKVLETTTDAMGRKIKVIKLPIPTPMYTTREDTSDIVDKEHVKARLENTRLAGSYVNFYITNAAIILPIFNLATDQQTIDIISTAFPHHKIEIIYAYEILLGGGNIHCITQQQL